MSKEALRLALEAGNGDEEWLIIAKQLFKHFPEETQRFAELVAEHERERIKAANAPEIERINAHIKELEDAVLAEREACAKDLYEASEAAKDVDPQGFVWRAVKECADAIRARGQA